MNKQEQKALEKIRQQIDETDQQIQHLLNQRTAMAQEVARIKIENGEKADFYRPEREAMVLRNVMARFSGATGLFECNASFEPEAAGITGVETECPSFPVLGGEIVPIPIPEAAPGALLTGPTR